MIKNKCSFLLVQLIVAVPCLAGDDDNRPPALPPLLRTNSPDDIAYYNFSTPRHAQEDREKLMLPPVVELSDEPTTSTIRRRRLREHRETMTQLSNELQALPFEQQRYVLAPIEERCSLSIQTLDKKDNQTRCERTSEFLLDNAGNLVSGAAGAVSFLVSIDDLFVDYLPDDATNADSWLTFLLIPTFMAGQIYQYARIWYKLHKFRQMNKEHERRYHDLKEAMRSEDADTSTHTMQSQETP